MNSVWNPARCRITFAECHLPHPPWGAAPGQSSPEGELHEAKHRHLWIIRLVVDNSNPRMFVDIGTEVSAMGHASTRSVVNDHAFTREGAR